jgi:catalase
MAAPSKDDLAPAQLGNTEILRGQGGETHQIAGHDVPVLTTQQGVPVGDDQNSLRIGERGPTLLEDFHFREKIFHFDHERIPERGSLDSGCLVLQKPADATTFVQMCRKLRFWERESTVHAV